MLNNKLPIIKLIRKNLWLVLVLVFGIFFRIFRPFELFSYSHDQDLAGWIVRDILYNHHLRLIGQETSSHGIFIGPYFYYLQIPFYLISRMDPVGPLLLPLILGVFTIFSYYFVFKSLFSKRVGLIAATIYAFSVLIIFTDREIAPTMPVSLWTVWFLYALHRILNGKKYGYLLVGLLAGFIWSINLQLIILFPLVLVAQYFSRKRIPLKEFTVAIFVALLLNVPFLASEARHGFQQTRALSASLITSKDYVPGTSRGFFPKLDRTMQLVYRNTTSLYWDSVFSVRYEVTFWLIVVGAFILLKKKKIDGKLFFILFLWQALYILFFTVNSINISEYYLNGMNVVFIFFIAFGINELNALQKTEKLGYGILGLFVLLNIVGFFMRPINRSGYVERKAVINEIKADAMNHGYPCVSLSFITSPGNNLGYRYFTWLSGLKTKAVSDGAPVYSIVYPLSKVDAVDKTFGVIGLVLPDYKRYNKDTVNKLCEGEDYTLTEPMFGFTQ